MFKKLKKKAFTLVELLVVIAILAILASVSVVGYLGFTENARKSKAVTELTQYKTMLLGKLASGSATLDNGTEDVATDDVTLTMIEQGKIEVAKKGDTDVKVVLNKFFGARDNSINVKYDTNDTNLIIYIDYTTDDNATASWNISTDEVVAGASTGGSETDPSEPTDPEEPIEPSEGILIISEYGEGSSENKWIEITNIGGKTLNLGDYSLKLYANGSTSATQTLGLSGELLPSNSWVYYHENANNSIKVENGTSNSQVINFNGDDVIGLYKNDECIDIIGKVGNPEKNNFTKDLTLIRKPEIKSPNTIYNEDEWNKLPKDSSNDIGKHTYNK